MTPDEELVTPSETDETPGPTPIVYPLGVVLWAIGTFAVLLTVPAQLRGDAFAIVLFLLPLAMALLAAFLNLFTRPGRPPRVRAIFRTLVFAALFPFVAWGEWDARRRKT